MKKYGNKQLNKLIAERNKLDAKIACIEDKIVEKNIEILLEETMNLQDGVGEGFVSADDYAEDRYYSKIDGVKNIRIHGDKLYVKIKDRNGYYVPNSIEVRGKEYEIDFLYTKGYDSELEY